MPNGLFQQNQNIPWITLEKTAMTLPSRRLQMLSPEMPHLKSLPKMTTHDTKYCRYSRNWCHVKRTRPKILPWFGNEWNKKNELDSTFQNKAHFPHGFTGRPRAKYFNEGMQLYKSHQCFLGEDGQPTGLPNMWYGNFVNHIHSSFLFSWLDPN